MKNVYHISRAEILSGVLRVLRRRKGITQRSMGMRILNIRYAHWERRPLRMPREMLRRFANECGVTIGFILTLQKAAETQLEADYSLTVQGGQSPFKLDRTVLDRTILKKAEKLEAPESEGSLFKKRAAREHETD